LPAIVSSSRASSLQLQDPEQAICLLCSPREVSGPLTLPGQQPAEILARWSKAQDSSCCTGVASPGGPGAWWGWNRAGALYVKLGHGLYLPFGSPAGRVLYAEWHWVSLSPSFPWPWHSYVACSLLSPG